MKKQKVSSPGEESNLVFGRNRKGRVNGVGVGDRGRGAEWRPGTQGTVEAGIDTGYGTKEEVTDQHGERVVRGTKARSVITGASC